MILAQMVIPLGPAMTVFPVFLNGDKQNQPWMTQGASPFQMDSVKMFLSEEQSYLYLKCGHTGTKTDIFIEDSLHFALKYE